MPKMTLAFELPEEIEEMKLALDGGRLAGDMDEFDNWLRAKIKYENLTPIECDLYEAVRAKFWEWRKSE